MFNIAIDGPSASGKSSIAKGLAKRLNLIHIDTGAMYRTIAFACLREGVSLDNEHYCTKVAESSAISFDVNGNVFLNGEDVSEKIRHDKISQAASIVSQHSDVREILVKKQQEMANEKGFVMDGRDITSVVLPDAELKIYQTADVTVRAERRYKQFLEQGLSVEFDDILEDLIARDYRDMNRDNSPLIKVDDAFEIDTTFLSVNEVIDLVINQLESRNIK
ncbi:(d)CMP kinase [Erysipelothrix urinaevulpis]|uniref:(d)CMP kinase n=1 Tax=Erysipelothrix urinaevulpis TaxID=2683717 RepID=UPI00135B8C87|nr:(d)CMP kinase [Erysipelothrix urinaevulpis]